MTTPTVRCSRLPLALECAQSLEAVPVATGPAGPAGALGTAFHAYMAALVKRQEPPGVLDLAVEHAVEHDELERLCAAGRRLWSQPMGEGRASLAAMMHGADTEVHLEHGALTGTLDVVAYLPDPGNCVFVVDYKSGWATDWDYSEQLRGYGWLAAHEWDAESAWLGVLNVRRGLLEASLWSRGQLDAWYAKSRERLVDPTFRAGAHCQRCPRAATCPAVESWLAQAVRFLGGAIDVLPGAPAELGPHLAGMLERAKAVEKRIDQAKELVKAVLAMHPEGLPLGGGRRLVLTATEQERVDGPAALPLLHDTASPVAGVIDNYVALTKSGLEKAVAEVAPPRGKGKMLREVLEYLRSHGALTTTTVERIEVAE